MTTGKALLAVVAGIAAGAALGLLFAPNKGVDTRKKIVKKGEDLVDEFTDKVEKKMDELLKSVKFSRPKSEDLADVNKMRKPQAIDN
ncbi:MAG: YtxH domain-containing protein [Cyclobacteriaceae bacterium]|nr:YtxH domain-containing protein [Cyclobacteriaceae bacterium]